MARGRDGYTLTELLVVLLILGLLAAAITPITIDQMNRAKARTARLQLEGLAATMSLFVADVGRLPTSHESLRALRTQPDGADGWAGPYLRNDEQLRDPWGNPIELMVPGSEGAPFDLKSNGADGAPGGEGANADIVVS